MRVEDLATATNGIAFSCNGLTVSADVPGSANVWEVIHDHLGLTGTKLACSRAVCGSCTIEVDGVPRASCAMFAFELEGTTVNTIEGIAAANHPLIDAFSRLSAFQCGYCTSGMIVLAKTLLDRDPHPDRATIVEWISSNICRCTGYEAIIDAVTAAAGDD